MTIIERKAWLSRHEGTVKLLNPVCVAYGHPDLDHTHAFLTDFGLVESHRAQDSDGTPTIYYRGYGAQPVIYISKQTAKAEFLGVFFEAESENDLHKAAQLPGAGSVQPWQHGGQIVQLTDPAGGKFHVVYGMQKREFSPRIGEVKLTNYPSTRDDDPIAKPRRGEFHRITRGIVPIHCLGHCGFVVEEDQLLDVIDFYCQNFNFKPSDILAGHGREENQVFLHIDLGKQYTQHHALILACPFGPLKAGTAHHAAFEIESIDMGFVGHEYMKSQNHRPFWGIGRHIEGSQVFDYWFDPDGFIVEHFADGDLVNEDKEVVSVPPTESLLMNNWGPPGGSVATWEVPRANGETNGKEI